MITNKKILILILGCENSPFIEIQKNGQETTWAIDNNNIYYYYYSDNIDKNYIKDNKYIYVKGKECIENCNKKTIDVFEYVLENFEFDYIYRTNISSYININNLISYCNNISNDNNFYGGLCGYWKELNIHFASGSGFLISKNLVSLLVTNKIFINYSHMDDVGIGEFLMRHNINIINIPRIDISNDKKDLPPVFLSFLPIVVPLLLITIKSLINLFDTTGESRFV